MSDFTAKIKAVLDDNTIASQLAAIGKSARLEINNIVVNPANIASQIQNAINSGNYNISVGRIDFGNLDRIALSAGNDIGRVISDSINSQVSSSLGSINLRNSSNAINNMQRVLRSFKFDDSSIGKITKNLTDMQLAITNVKTTMAGSSVRLTVSGIDEMQRAVTVVKQLDASTGTIETLTKTFNQSFTDTNAEQAVKTYQELQSILKNIGSLEVKLQGLDANKDSNQIAELSNQLNTLTESYNRLRDSSADILNQDQLSGLTKTRVEIDNKIAEVNARLMDKTSNQESIKKSVEAYKELANILKSMTSISMKIDGLDPKQDANQISVLTEQLNTLQLKFEDLNSSSMGLLNADQLKELDKLSLEMGDRVAQTEAKLADSNAQRENQESIKQSVEAYKELESILKQISSLEVKRAGLDVSKDSNQIKELTSQIKELESAYSKAFSKYANPDNPVLSTDQINKLWDMEFGQKADREYNAESLANARRADQNAIQESIAAYRELQGIVKEISSIELKIAGLDSSANANQITALNEQLTTLQQRMGDILSQSPHLFTSDQFSDLNKSAQQAQAKMAELEGKMADVQARATEKIQLKIDNGSIDASIASVTAQYEKLGATGHESLSNIQADIAILNQLQAAMADPTQSGQLITNYSEFEKVLARVKNSISIVKSETAGMSSATASALNFKDILKSVTGIYSYISAIRLAIRYTKQMAQEVLAVDTSMTGLRRVTDLSSEQYTTMYKDMVGNAKQYGATLTEIIDGTTNWVKLGFDPETSKELANITAMYQHVTDLDTGTATKNLITAYKGFEKTLLDQNGGDITSSVMQIADIYDKLGNEFAESAADVGDGLSKSAAVLQEGGASIQEAAGMFTGIQEVLQDSGKAGNTLKILTLRIRGMKGELEELGEEVDDKIDSISKIQTQILNLTHGKVNIFEDDGSFKNITQIMRELAAVQGELSDTESAELLELIAGKSSCPDVQKCA